MTIVRASRSMAGEGARVPSACQSLQGGKVVFGKAYSIALALCFCFLAFAGAARARMCIQVFIKIVFREKITWQTYRFVRNQMDLILSKDLSTFTTPRETRLRLMTGRKLPCAGVALHRTNLSVTALTARSDSRPRKLLTRKVPSHRVNLKLPLANLQSEEPSAFRKQLNASEWPFDPGSFASAVGRWLSNAGGPNHFGAAGLGPDTPRNDLQHPRRRRHGQEA